jgi:hypothetical protein
MTRRVLVLAAVAAVVAAAVPGTASAASGTSVLTLKGAAATSLSGAGVKVSAVAPATAKGKAITLPVRSATVGATASLGHSGAIRFKKGSRTLTLKAPALRLAASGSRLTVKLGGRTTTILTVDAAKRSLNASAGTAALKGASVKLTAAGAAAIRRALKVKALKSGTLGTLTIDASRGGAGAPGTGGSGAGGSGTTGSSGSAGGGSTGGGSGGTGGGGAPQSCASGPVAAPSGGPAALTAPPTSVPVMAASITWHVRDSFIQYINSGEGTAVANGATADPASVQPGSSASLVYGFHFPFKEGWYDPATGSTRLTYSGTVLFCYAGHGIKLTASNPEIEITPAGSRGIFVTGNVGAADRRGVLVNLENVARADDGATRTWSQMPGRIPAAAGDSTFAGYYAAGDPFGWITVSATTP